MWAKYKKQSGFTIVELLIVIVVIGILAVITIVAFNSIQERARNSSISSALGQVVKKLVLYQTEYGTYPTSLAIVSIQNSGDLSYQYSYTSNTYCVTATIGQQSRYVSETQQNSQSGACVGHGSSALQPITSTYLQASESSADISSYTFPAQNIGTPSASRTIIVAVAARSADNKTLNSVSVGGQPAQIDKQYSVNGSTAALASIKIPNGTVADVTITFSGGMVRSVIGLYHLTGNVVASSTGEGSNSLSLVGAENGIVILAAFRATVTTMSWNGATLNENVIAEGSHLGSFASTNTNGPITITTTGNGSNFSLAGVAYSPL